MSKQAQEDGHSKTGNLRTIFLLHGEVVDITEKVNEFFAPVIVAYVSVTYVNLLFGFFFMARVLFWSWGKNIELLLLSFDSILWSLNACFAIYLLLYVCENVRSEIYASSRFVHQLIQQKPTFLAQNDRYYHQMKAFIIQSLHQRKVFSFSVLGLFSLDFAFIFSVRNANRKKEAKANSIFRSPVRQRRC